MTVLIPSVFDRSAESLYKKLLFQAKDKPVSVIMVTDNRSVTIGEKRNMCKDLVQTEYWCMIDDDDDITDNFIELILAEINKNHPDQITFNTYVTLTNKDGDVIKGVVETKATNDNDEFKADGITNRHPIHVHVWRTELVKGVRFPDKNYHEDFIWGYEANKYVRNSVYIPSILHYYKWSENNTLAKYEESGS